MPPVTQNLLIANVAVWLVVQLAIISKSASLNTLLDNNFMLFPVASGMFRPWQLVTYMFTHVDFWHILLNMWPLWMFGRTLEYELGSKRFLLYYMVCGIGAGLIQLLVYHLAPPATISATLGASGAVFGILLAFGMLYPNHTIGLIFPPIVMKAKWFVVAYGVIELVAGISNRPLDNVAHFAHLGGMLFGFLLLWWWRRR